ncbi:MAG: hypothetical protein AABX89_00200 [Candidatus Thermoplasmatota archaeon]
MARPFALLVALAVVALLPATAAAPFLSEVAGNDADINGSLSTVRAPFAFADANGNGRLDNVAPTEPIYVDLDGSNSVSYGDIRLAPFGSYAAGTRVDVTNRDVGRLLTATPGWFARATSVWIADLDNSQTATAWDVQFSTGSPTYLAAGDALIGQQLTAPAGNSRSLAVTTSGGLFLDAESFTSGSGRVSPGDLRITPGPFASDDTPTPASSSGSSIVQANESGWRVLDGLLLVLTALNLVGLLFVVRTLTQLRGPPKNPFK